MKLLKLVIVSLLLAPTATVAQDVTNPPIDDSAIIRESSIQKSTFARNGMVVSQEFHASEAGLEMLKKGGNAIDAAVATAFALAVTYPQAGNIGGGGFMMIYLEEENRVVAVDFREMAPAAAHRDMFLDEKGNADAEESMWSIRSSGVPGSVAGLLYALDNYGTMSRSQVMAPAIRLAKDGIPMSWQLFRSLSVRKERLSKSPASLKYFYKNDGSVYQPGEVLKQKDLARTLKLIAKNGRDGFYKGETADEFVATMKKHGGLITHKDLEKYVVKERTPVSGSYHDYQIYSMPPVSSGGVHVVQMLNVLEGFDLKPLGHNSAAYIHRLVETMKYAYADRSEYLGDPDYYDVPIAGLTDKKYAASIRGKFDLERATPSKDIGPAPKLPFESNETTHFSVADKMGNVVSMTTTLNFSYGNAYSVAGAGFLLNNEMDDFSSKPGTPNGFGLLGGEANAIEAGKRPLSSMTPTIVLKNGKPFIVTGSPGGSRIITAVLQNILNMTTFGMTPQEANAAPRVHHQWYPDAILVEPGIGADTVRILQSMGHNIPLQQGEFHNGVMGSVQTIMIKDGILRGGKDSRVRGSHAAAY